jgi:diguanylate cyclase (GGDEF)-like protein
LVNAFTAEDVALLTVVAGYIAGALGVAREYERLQRLSATDPLTKLPNRRHFLEGLDLELARSARSGSPMAIVLLDLDNFKAINDVYGHAAGDAALIQVGTALRRRLRTTDTVARYGGDEFMVLLYATDPELIPVIMQRVTPITVTVNEAPQTITLAWGAASRPRDGTEATALLRIADTRLYAMKKGVRDGCVAQRLRW